MQLKKQRFMYITELNKPDWLDSSEFVSGFYNNFTSELFIGKPKDLEAHTDWTQPKRFSIHLKPENCQVYVMLTQLCNYACGGCATSIDKIKNADAASISDEVLHMAIERCLLDAIELGYKSIKFKWGGGEPLIPSVAIKIFKAQKIIDKYNHLINVNQVILTNGVYLTSEVIQKASESNIDISVSVWGTQKFHDLMRRPRNKLESFSRVIRNIEILKEKKSNFSVNYVLTHINAKDFPDFIDMVWNPHSELFYSKTFLEPLDVFFAIYRPVNQNFSDEQLKNMYSSIYVKGIKPGFKSIFEIIKAGVNIQPLTRFDYINLAGVAPTTCGSGINYVSINSQGISSCHEGLYKINSKHTWKELNQKNIFLESRIDTNKLIGTSFSSNPLNSLHGGTGCPRIRNKDNTKVITQFYEKVMNDLLALEAIRLSKI